LPFENVAIAYSDTNFAHYCPTCGWVVGALLMGSDERGWWYHCHKCNKTIASRCDDTQGDAYKEVE